MKYRNSSSRYLTAENTDIPGVELAELGVVFDYKCVLNPYWHQQRDRNNDFGTEMTNWKPTDLLADCQTTSINGE
jgi:hypothetical protein